MAILFCGAELEDFSYAGQVANNGSQYRTAYARTSVAMNQNSGPAFGTYLKASFAPQSSIGVTARAFPSSINFTANNVFLWLATGGSARLGLRINSGSPSTISLVSITSGGTQTVLATTSLTLAAVVGNNRFDLLITYAVAGRVRLYIDGALGFDFSGDVTASGTTTLDGLYLSTFRNNGQSEWSEVIVTDGEDSRPLSVKTLVPNATGDVSGWQSGGWAEIDDTIAADIDQAVSFADGAALTVNTTGMPTGASGLSVRAVKSVALAVRGATGVSRLALGVRQSSTNGFASGVVLDTGYGTVSQTWTTNPITGAAFTSTEIENLQLAYRSEA